jgi:hypothetical protein
VWPGFFEAVGIPLRQGRLPVEADLTPVASCVVLSETAAKRLFPGTGAAGKPVAIGGVSTSVSRPSGVEKRNVCSDPSTKGTGLSIENPPRLISRTTTFASSSTP